MEAALPPKMKNIQRHRIRVRIVVPCALISAFVFAIVSTVVQFKSWLGRAYFLLVRPFHKLIVPAMLRTAYQRYPNNKR